MKNNGYLSAEYAESFVHQGEAVSLRHSNSYIIKRQIKNTGLSDAMGCYPFFCCGDWTALKQDFEASDNGLVSISLVTDPFGDFNPDELKNLFPDKFIDFKKHFVVDLEKDWRSGIKGYHLRNIKKASSELNVEHKSNPHEWLADWCGLYRNLVERHEIKGVAEFSCESFARQFNVPGLEAFRAVLNGNTVGMSLWMLQGEFCYYHLGAYSETGYDKCASYTIFDAVLNHYSSKGVRLIGLGAGAGAGGDGNDGLTRFKKGWSNDTRRVYFCGKILDSQKYKRITEFNVAADTTYFPAYRAGEFA